MILTFRLTNYLNNSECEPVLTKNNIKLSANYEAEQKELEARIKELQEFVANEKEKYLNDSYLIKLVKKYTEINKLTDEIVQKFIQKIVIHHKVIIDDVKTGQIDIYYNGVGHLEI